MVAPFITLMFTCKCFVADRTARREIVFVARRMVWCCFVNEEVLFGNRLVTEGATKMFGMPVGVERVEMVAENRLGAALTNPCDCHKLGWVRAFGHVHREQGSENQQVDVLYYNAGRTQLMAITAIA